MLQTCRRAIQASVMAAPVAAISASKVPRNAHRNHRHEARDDTSQGKRITTSDSMRP
jgi:hypothetical protein